MDAVGTLRDGKDPWNIHDEVSPWKYGSILCRHMPRRRFRSGRKRLSVGLHCPSAEGMPPFIGIFCVPWSTPGFSRFRAPSARV